MDKLNNTVHKWCIVQELHKNGLPHLHIILCFSAEVDRAPCNIFDLRVGDKTWHGNYKSLVSEPHAFQYLNKEYKPIHNYSADEEAQLMELAKEKLTRGKYNKKGIDWESTSRRIMAGEDILLLCDEQPALFMHLDKIQKNLDAWKRMKRKRVAKIPTLNNTWYWGPTGAGKSKLVWEKHGTAFLKSKDEWWSEYDMEPIVHCPDVDETWFYLLGDLKNIADHYPFKARVKCDKPLEIRPEQIIVTSNYTIRECLGKYFEITKRHWDESLVKAIERRFTQIRIDEAVNPDPCDVFPVDYFWDPIDCNPINELVDNSGMNIE